MTQTLKTLGRPAFAGSFLTAVVLLAGCCLVLSSCSSKSTDVRPPIVQSVISDFDDGSLAGWTKLDPFGGTLQNPGDGGNPGGYLEVADEVSGGGWLAVIAPSEFNGDLSVFSGISWDEYIWPNTPAPNCCTFSIIEASDGTRYCAKDRSPKPEGAWQQRFIPFDDSSWTLSGTTGTQGFEDVLKDVATLMINMDVSQCSFRRESGIDNVTLLAEVD